MILRLVEYTYPSHHISRVEYHSASTTGARPHFNLGSAQSILVREGSPDPCVSTHSVSMTQDGITYLDFNHTMYLLEIAWLP